MALSSALALPRIRRVASGGGGGYTTGGVAFDGTATYLLNSSLSCTNNGVLTWSMWFFQPASANLQSPLYVSDPANQYDNDMVLTNLSQRSIEWDFGNNSSFFGSTNDTLYATGIWTWTGGSADITTMAQNKRSVFLNDTNATGSPSSTGTGGTMSINGLPLYVGYDQTNFADCYLADVWIAPGQYLDFTIQANRRKFIDGSGKPVSLGADGSTPTGTAPAIFLRRAPGAAASTFATNLGTGGNFTITGTLTNAPSSPTG